MDWLEVRLQGGLEKAPHAELMLQDLGFPGWVEESCEQGFSYLVYLPQEGAWQERLQSLRSGLQSFEVALSTHAQVRDEDWAENWKRFYHPLPVGKRLVVCPSWEDFTPKPDQKVIVLDPGSAFGTGYHWTTRLCLEFLEDLSEQTVCSPMLDLGTGSGILAIAAHLLGIQDILAVDNDPVACKVARENLDINQGQAVGVELRDTPPAGPFALISANLVAALLVDFAARLFASLKPGGHLICGGIIEGRRQEVVAALESQGFQLLHEKTGDEWVSLLLVRP